MKSFIIFITFISAIQLSHQSDFATQIRNYFNTHEELRNECMVKVHVDKDIEYKYENGDIVNDETLGCFVKCILLKEKVINEAGEVSIEYVKRSMQLPENDNLTGLMEKCSQFDKTDLCHGALQFAACYSDYMKSHLVPQ